MIPLPDDEAEELPREEDRPRKRRRWGGKVGAPVPMKAAPAPRPPWMDDATLLPKRPPGANPPRR